jgi:squalene synthase HpnC
MDTYWVEREYLRGRERAENFPVALRILPRHLRRHLTAVYGVARVIDDLGDEAPDDRVARLTAFQEDLAAIWIGGQPQAPVLRQLAPTVARCALSEQPFRDLIQANLYDQRHSSYRSYADLLAYCELSANPVGRIVLEIFGAADPINVARSDKICTALQIIEHCQDVAEDARAGRCYLPQEDLDRFGVTAADWSARPTAPALRRVVAFELDRCAGLLDASLPLVARLRGWARLAVAGYAAGGRAALLAILRQKCDVMSVSSAPRRLDSLRQMIATLSGRGVAG